MQVNDISIQAARSDEKRWFAIHTRHQHEHLVNHALASKGFETFFPSFISMHKWKDRKKQIRAALFPGYLFVKDIGERRLQIVMTPGVCAIVGVSGVPAIIPELEIESIRLAVSSPCAVEPCSYLKEGDRIRVGHGPLSGAEGLLVRKGKSTRLVICVEILGRAAAVEIDGADVETLAQRRDPFLTTTVEHWGKSKSRSEDRPDKRTC